MKKSDEFVGRLWIYMVLLGRILGRNQIYEQERQKKSLKFVARGSTPTNLSLFFTNLISRTKDSSQHIDPSRRQICRSFFINLTSRTDRSSQHQNRPTTMADCWARLAQDSPPSVDLIVVGAKNHSREMIDLSIASVEHTHEFRSKTIIIDGFGDINDNEDCDRIDALDEHVDQIRVFHDDFDVIHGREKNYFRKNLIAHLQNSDADYIVVIQDDVKAPENINIADDISFMERHDECKLLSYPHMVIPDEGTNWFRPIENVGEYMKVHGWTERVFIAERETFYENICEPVRGKKAEQFCEYNYHNAMNRAKAKGGVPSDEFWSKWGCFLKQSSIHTHMVGKREIAKKYSRNDRREGWTDDLLFQHFDLVDCRKKIRKLAKIKKRAEKTI